MEILDLGDFNCFGTSSLKYCVEHFDLNNKEWTDAAMTHPNLIIYPIFYKTINENNESAYIIRFMFKLNDKFSLIYEDEKTNFKLKAISRKISDQNFDINCLYEFIEH